MGYDNECIVNLQSLPGEYFCPVCRTLIYPNEALQAQCTHLFCRPCLSYVATTTRACPYDGYLVTEADSKPLVESSKELAETIDKVAVHCLYHRSGCQWQGTLAESTAHGTDCTYGHSPVVCNRCGTQIVHRQVQEHAQICPGVQPQGQAAETVAAATQPTGAATSSTPTALVPNTAAAPIIAAPTAPTAATPALAPVPGAAAPTHEQWYQQQQMQYQQYYQQQYPGYDPYHQQQYAQYQQYAQPQMQAPPQPFPPQAPNQAPQQPYMPPQQYPQPQVRPPPQQVPQPQQPPMQMQPQPQPQMQPPAHAVSGYQSFPQSLPGPPPRPMHVPPSQFPPQQPFHMRPPPHSQGPMPPQQQPGMPPHQQPGMPPHQQPGMPPQQQPGMPPQQQLGMPPQQQGYQQPHGFQQQVVRPQAPPNYPPNAPSQGMTPYQQPNQARLMLPAQGMPQQQPQIPHSTAPATPNQGPRSSDKSQSGEKALDKKGEGDKNENGAREKDGKFENDGKNISNGDKPVKAEDGSKAEKDISAPNSMMPNQGQVASNMHLPPSQQNAFPPHGHGYTSAPHQQYPPGPPPHQNPYGPPHIPDPRHAAAYQPPPQMPISGQALAPNQMRPPAPQDSFWPPPHAGVPNQSMSLPPLGGMPGHQGFPPTQNQLPLPPHPWPAMEGPPPRGLEARGPPFIHEDRPLAKANGMASNIPEDRFRPPFIPEGFRPPHDEHFRPPLRDFNEDLKQFPRPAHLDAEGPTRFDNFMPPGRPGGGSNALAPRASRPDGLNHTPEFGRRSPGHAGRDFPDGIKRGPNDFGSPNLPRNNNFGGHPNHPGYNEHFGLGSREDDNFQHSRKRMAGNMVRCLICKIDCETLEGLEVHTQGREHQQIAMDMVMNIKKENAKKHKSAGIANPIEDGNNAKMQQNFEKRGNMQ